MSTVILSSGSSVIVIIGVVVWVVSVILKNKKTAQKFIRVQPQDTDQSENEETAYVPLKDQQSSERLKRKQGKNVMTHSKEGLQSTVDNENKRYADNTNDDSLKSEYSLENPDDAKRAIIYSEILKPKF